MTKKLVIVLTSVLLCTSKLGMAATVSFSDATGMAGLSGAKSLAIVVINGFMAIQILNAVRLATKPDSGDKMNLLIYKLFIPLVVMTVLTMIF